MKLYRVTYEIEFLALAENEHEACAFTKEAIRDVWPEDDAYATPWGGHLPSGWGVNDLLYHNQHGKDITVAEAIKIDSEAATKP